MAQLNGYLEEAIRAQFDALEQTSNWRSERASELFEIGIGKTPPRKEPEWFSNNPRGNFVWLSIKDMGEPGAYSFDSSEYLTPQAVVTKNVRRVPKGSVLLSFKLTIGRVKIAAVDMTTNEAIACFASDDPAKLAYLYPFLLSFDYNGLGSTSSIATAVNSKTIKNMTIVMPDSNTLAEFYANTKPLYEAIMNSMLENMSLKALRDALLPKLMSGEIDVTQLNSHLAELHLSTNLAGAVQTPNATAAFIQIGKCFEQRLSASWFPNCFFSFFPCSPLQLVFVFSHISDEAPIGIALTKKLFVASKKGAEPLRNIPIKHELCPSSFASHRFQLSQKSLLRLLVVQIERTWQLTKPRRIGQQRK